jgi:carboxylesterase type B
MRAFVVAAIVLGVAPLLAAEPKVHRDLPYTEAKKERQSLDVYAPADGSEHPVVVWIHGGG